MEDLPQPPPQLSSLLDSEMSEADIVHGFLLWTLWRASIDPMKTSPAQVAEMLTALAAYRASGGGEDEGLKTFLGKLELMS